MDATQTNIAAAFTNYASKRMQSSLSEIERCVTQLNEEQMQARGAEHENSIVNLLTHLEGNIRQWILHGVGEHLDVRNRDAEFALGIEISGADAFAKLRAVVEQACGVIEAVNAERLLEVIDPQPTGVHRHFTVLAAIAKAMGHLEHHTGQIILLTKQAVGRDLDLSMPRKR